MSGSGMRTQKYSIDKKFTVLTHINYSELSLKKNRFHCVTNQGIAVPKSSKKFVLKKILQQQKITVTLFFLLEFLLGYFSRPLIL